MVAKCSAPLRLSDATNCSASCFSFSLVSCASLSSWNEVWIADNSDSESKEKKQQSAERRNQNSVYEI